MKIGLVCPYNLTKGGGVQEVVLALQRGLSARGHEVKVITPLPRDVQTQDWPQAVFIGAATDIKSPFATTAQVSVSLKTEEIESVLEREAFDILHFHEPWVPMMSRQLLSRSNCINIATFHARLPDTFMSKSIEAVVTPYTKPLLRHLQGLTAVSDAAAEYVRSLTSRPIDIIPNGIDLAAYKDGPGNKQHDERTILFIGRLEKRKGLKYLLKAFQLLQATHPSTRLVLAGDGPDREKLEAFVKEQHLKHVSFEGFVDEARKLELLRQADVFCSPALYGESFGIVLLEAMAVGLPVIAGDNPGYESVLQGRGRLSLVNPRDSVEFARRLCLFLEDEELRALWLSWAEAYVQQFDYENIVDKYERLYKELAVS